jgi:hypothetical protein
VAEQSADDWARQAAELADRPSPGKRVAAEAVALLDKADRLAQLAQQHTETAAAARSAAARARDNRDAVQQASDRNRFALRLAGTSRTEQRQFVAQYAAQADAAEAEGQEATNAAETLQVEAWNLITAWKYAEILGVAGGGEAAPGDPAALHDRLPALAANVDYQHAENVRYARTQTVELRARAGTLRADAAAAEAELELRRRIAGEAPGRSAAESAARDEALREAGHTAPAAVQRRAGQWRGAVAPPDASARGLRG